jgi:hypothetical protein
MFSTKQVQVVVSGADVADRSTVAVEYSRTVSDG